MDLINFPVSPSINQTFTLGSKTWIWNGYAWDLQLVNVGPIFTQANNAASFANGAFVQANNISAYANAQIAITQGVDATQNTNIALAASFANGAFTKANSSVQLNANSQTITGNLIINGALNVTGNVTLSGNVTQVSGNSGQFFGYGANGFNALYTGIPVGYLLEPQIVTQITSNYNGYAGGINMQNINSGSNASSDLFISADNGTLYDGFLDIGLGSSTYSYPGYTLIGPNDGYWIVTGNTITNGGNMILSTGYNNDIIFAQGGTSTGNEVARFKYNVGLVFKSNGITFADSTTQNTAAAPYGYSNASYSKANSAGSFANGAFVTANSAASFANAAFTQANNISAYANTQIANLIGIENTQNNNITSAQSFANGAFTTANNAYGQANNAVNIGNAASVTAGLAYGQANSAYMLANNALIIGVSASNFANAAFTTANNALSNTSSLITVNGSSQVLIANTTASTSSSTGALLVNGGVGITGNIYAGGTSSYFGGKVGIGTTPIIPFDVAGSINVTGNWYATARFLNTAATQGLELGYNSSSNNSILAAIQQGSGLEFWTNNNAGGGWLSSALLDKNGNFMVGMTAFNSTGVSGTSGPTIASNAFTVGNSTTNGMYVRMGGTGIGQLQTNISGSNSGYLNLQPYGGSVSIGTTTPSSALTVVGAITSAANIYGSTNATAGIFRGADSTYGTYAFGSINIVSESANYYSGAITFNTSVNINSTGPVEWLRITSAGALAFNGASNYGTSGQILQSNGNAPPTWVSPGAASAAGYINATANTNAFEYIVGVNAAGASNAAATIATSVPVGFNASSGYVGIGTTSPGSLLHIGSVQQQKHVITSNSNHIEFFKDATPSYAAAIGLDTPASGSLNSALLFSTYNGSSWLESMRLDINGNQYLGYSSITTTGTGFTNGSSLLIAGQVSIGSNAPRAVNNTTRALTIEGNGANSTGISAIRNSADSNPFYFNFVKTRGSTNGANTAVQSGDNLGIIYFNGADGTTSTTSIGAVAAEIYATVNGTVSSGVVPGQLNFATASSAGSITTNMVIAPTGYVGVNTTTPSANLTVAGSTLIQNAANTASLGTTIIQATTATTAQTAIDSWSTTSYRSAKYMVQMTQSTNFHVIELLLLQNGTTVYLTQYGEMYNNIPLGTFDASITSTTLSLLINPASANSTAINIVRDGISV